MGVNFPSATLNEEKAKLRCIRSSEHRVSMGKIFQVFVLGIKGEKKTIDVAQSETDFNNMTVLVFKEKITDKFPELKGQNFRAMYADKQLQDEETFSEHEIKNGSIIVLVLRLPGGSAL
ncbi:uncharacterized protein [Salminus brasiliensis]|uniref:uncharacterized protein n=1 Tax=Salminus brasiliensis TaxID=930266 RepID=UPI003B8314C7